MNGVTFEVHAGELFGVIGPNGAGKTVLLNVVSSVYQPDRGEVYIDSVKTSTLKPHELFMLGVARTFQITKSFPEMTVLQNILTTLHAKKPRMSLAEKTNIALECLKQVGLAEAIDMKAKTLSGGQRKLLEFARLLASEAKLLLLDEPFAGVNPIIINRMLEILKKMAEKGAAVVVVSHELAVISRLCNRVIVLDRGSKIAEGTLREVALMNEVKRAYLGV